MEKDEPTQDPNWANDSILYLNNFISEHRIFECILGCSQGATFIFLYIYQIHPMTFQKVIIMTELSSIYSLD